MKLSHFSILFVAIMIVLIVTSDYRSDNLSALASEKNHIDEYMEKAVDSAVESLLQIENNSDETSNIDQTVDSFFSSMYSSLGLLSDTAAQNIFRAYVPAIAVTMEDGYFLMYCDYYVDTDGYISLSKRWTEKKPYVFEDNNFIYRFTMGNKILLYDKKNLINTIENGVLYQFNFIEFNQSSEYESIRNRVRNTDFNNFLLNEEKYKLVKQQAIISCVEEDLSWYVSKHNDIAKHFGITYQFAFPITDSSEWSKTIEGPGLIVVFQGMPLVENPENVYNRVAFSGAGYKKGSVYYVEQKSWYYIYHKEGCRKLKNNPNVWDEQYDSVEEVVKLGCYACDECGKGGIHVPNYEP